METQFNRKVEQIISDKGTEFTNVELKEVSKESGIQLILTLMQEWGGTFVQSSQMQERCYFNLECS